MQKVLVEWEYGLFMQTESSRAPQTSLGHGEQGQGNIGTQHTWSCKCEVTWVLSWSSGFSPQEVIYYRWNTEFHKGKQALQIADILILQWNQIWDLSVMKF